MGSGESTQDVSSTSELGTSHEEEAVDIDFRLADNPAMNRTHTPPTYDHPEREDGEGVTQYPEMNFRGLVDSISWQGDAPLTHAIHKHPAVFIPHIPRYLIETFTDQQNEDGGRPTILDPFCGSGTTGVEAKIAGRDFIGVEINPVSKLVAEVSTTPIPYTVIKNTKEEVLRRLDETPVEYYENYDVEFLDRTNKEHWFEEPAIESLTTIRKVVSEFLDSDFELTTGTEPRERKVIKDRNLSDSKLRDQVGQWLVLMIANTVFEVSNADPDVSKAHKSKKMRRLIDDGNHPPDPVAVYREQLEDSQRNLIDLWNEVYRMRAPGGTTETVIINGAENSTIHEYSDNWVPVDENPAHKAQSDIRLGDARSFSFPKYKGQIDMAITSPPYINAINYYRGTKLRLFWIHDLLEENTEIDAEEIKRSIIGTNATTIKDFHDELPYLVSDKWDGVWEEYEETSLPELDDHILKIHHGELTEATSRAYITYKFFAEDMLQSLTQVYRHLKPGAYFFFIIGENTIGGRVIESHQFVADIAQNLGKFSYQDADIHESAGYRLAGMAWDTITRRDLFQGRDHGKGVIEREWVVILQKPRHHD